MTIQDAKKIVDDHIGWIGRLETQRGDVTISYYSPAGREILFVNLYQSESGWKLNGIGQPGSLGTGLWMAIESGREAK